MKRWDLLRDLTLAVMGAAIVALGLLVGPADPVLLMLGASMLGLPAFLFHFDSKPQPVKVAGVEFEQWRREFVRLDRNEVVRPVRQVVALAQAPDRLTAEQQSVEARLRRFPKLGTEQRMHLARTLDPAIVQLDDDAIRQRLGEYGTPVESRPTAPLCGYCTVLKRRCACRR